MNKKITLKIFSISILIILVISPMFTAVLSATLPTVDPAAQVTLKGSKTITLTASDIASMPTYTGVGSPRRSGGVFPLQMLGNYTGVPLMYLCNLVGGISSSSIVTVSTTVDGYSAALTYDQVHNNVFTQYNISTHDVISGQNPIIILAYGVNGTTLTSDGTDSDTDLGGPLRLFVVSNNGTSPILMNDGMATFGNTFVKYVTDIEITNPGSLTFKTCDSSGAAKSSFAADEPVYFSATGLSASKTYPIYVVQDVSAWVVRIPFPERVANSASSVTTDSSGNIAATSIYTNTPGGKYAVIVDVDSDGQYDESDLLITNVVTTASTTTISPTTFAPSTATPSATPTTSPVVPEFSSATIVIVLLVIVTVLVLILVRKKK